MVLIVAEPKTAACERNTDVRVGSLGSLDLGKFKVESYSKVQIIHQN